VSDLVEDLLLLQLLHDAAAAAVGPWAGATILGGNASKRLLDVRTATSPRGLTALTTRNLVAHGDDDDEDGVLVCVRVLRLSRRRAACGRSVGETHSR